MFRKHILRNRTLAQWLTGATLLSTDGCDLAAGILSTVAAGLRIFS